MRTDDPRAAGFDATAFRDAITFAMNMGMPENEDERATFKWKQEMSFAVTDPASRPYRWEDAPEKTVTKEDVQVPVAIEKSPGLATSTSPFGAFENPRITITVLDEYYTLIKGADTVELDGTEYTINFVAPPISLFEVTVYTIYAQADDES